MDTFDTGTQFNFTYADGVSLEQMIGFEMAGEFWSQQLADNVTINIFVEMTDALPENVVGGALPGIEENILYSTYRNKLQQDITSDIDSLINYNQQNDADKFTAYFDAEYDINGFYKVDNNQYIKMTRANAKALDMINPHDTGLDGYILMRDLDGVGDGELNSVQWSYNYETDVIDSNSLDFLSVAIHEIGHTLGFISGLDQADWLAGKRNLNAENEDDYYSSMIGNLNNATPVDLLRFSSGSNFASGSGDSWIDMSLGGNPYLSFDGGQTTVAYFATGENTELGGDGNQASHWKEQENALGIMDPVLQVGQRREISQLDTQLFDAIGWDIRSDNSGSADLATIHGEAKQILADKITVTAQTTGTNIDSDALAQWLQDNSQTEMIFQTSEDEDEDEDEDEEESQNINQQSTTEVNPDIITEMVNQTVNSPYVDSNGDGIDDRGETLNDMVVNSGTVYQWGWQGYWWGWQGYWWGWKGYWQSSEDFSQDGFWQNFSWQSVDLSDTSLSNTESLESDIADIFGKSNILQPEFYVADIIVDNYLARFNSDLTIENPSDNKELDTMVDNQPNVDEIVTEIIDNNETLISEFATLDLELLDSLLSEKLENILDVDDELVMPIN